MPSLHDTLLAPVSLSVSFLMGSARVARIMARRIPGRPTAINVNCQEAISPRIGNVT